MAHVAKREDWQSHPLPEEWQSLRIDRRYTAREFVRIAEGLIPEEMEDKWFVFYEEPWLYLHRSWTGYCVYIVRFEPCEDIMMIAEALVNRDESQHTETDDDIDVVALAILLDGRAGRPIRALWDRYAQHHLGRRER